MTNTTKAAKQRFEVVLGEIRDSWESGVPRPEVLYHYTTWEGFEGIVSTRRFWATAHECTNDPAELASADEAIADVAASLRPNVSTPARKVLDVFRKDFPAKKLSKRMTIYFTSFSAARDKASQWKDYGAVGAGICLGIKVLRDEPQVEESAYGKALVRVNYSETEWRDRLSERFERILAETQKFIADHFGLREWAARRAWTTLFVVAGHASMTVKRPAWADEAEWRLVAVSDPDVDLKALEHVQPSGKRYLDLRVRADETPLALHEVVIGPSQGFEADTAEARVKDILHAAGYPHALAPMPEVIASTLGFHRGGVGG
jgi:hypothetical protein